MTLEKRAFDHLIGMGSGFKTETFVIRAIEVS